MAVKRITDFPTITDTIIFDILTPDSSGCYNDNPYSINSITIYYVERDYNNSNFGEYDAIIDNSSILADLEEARRAVCALNLTTMTESQLAALTMQQLIDLLLTAPTEGNILLVERLQAQLLLNRKTSTFYYQEARPVAVFGTSEDPVWLDTGDPVADAENALIWGVTNIDEDSDGSEQYDRFELKWEPEGIREGDYFICWTWVPTAGGDFLAAHDYFSLIANTQVTTSIPTHFTQKDKYQILFERYLPSMFKTHWQANDLSPEVLQEFGNAVGDSFTSLEDMANQMVDLLDANAIHESILPHLSSLFGLKLRSADPTLWRRQTKRAVALFKKKGTMRGLTEALAQAGIEFEKFTKLWQVISPWTWQELFDAEDDQTEFELSFTMVLPLDDNNFELYYRGVDDDSWTTLSSDYVSMSNFDGTTTMTWVGQLLSINPIILEEGDSIRVVYEIDAVPAVSQTIEDYIRSLSLMDQRDERDQDYPPKNWNVRLIEEDDAFFDIIIPVSNPFYDPLIFGKIRTEFPYSENIYNMEEYNGSTRDSREPCHIDRDFTDECKGCQSSKFTVDIDIENLSNDRIIEAQEIINEFTPFHATLHSINFSGLVNEYVEPPVERVESLVNIVGEDTTISGNAQMIFNRVTEDGTNSIKRNVLADTSFAAGDSTTWITGTGYNSFIALYSPDVRLDDLGFDPANNVLDILTGVHIGNYSIEDAENNQATVIGIPALQEPVSASSFTFNLSNNNYFNNSTDIVQEFIFDDPNVDIAALWDAANPSSAYDQTWVIEIPAYPWPDPPPVGPDNPDYGIVEITSAGILINDYSKISNTLPIINTTGITYTIKTIGGTTISTSATGTWTSTTRGIVDYSFDVGLTDIRNVANIGDYVLHLGIQYKIDAFIIDETHRLYISGYTLGDAVGAVSNIFQRLVNNQVGYLDYKQMVLETAIDYESTLGILNGVNAPVDPNDILETDLFMESFLVLINNALPDDDDNFAMANIDGTTITLDGPHTEWTTLAKGGTSVEFKIIKYSKQALYIPERVYPPMPGHDFDQAERSQYLDRRGNDVVEINTETAVSGLALIKAMNSDDGFETMVEQQEAVSFTIEYK